MTMGRRGQHGFSYSRVLAVTRVLEETEACLDSKRDSLESEFRKYARPLSEEADATLEATRDELFYLNEGINRVRQAMLVSACSLVEDEIIELWKKTAKLLNLTAPKRRDSESAVDHAARCLKEVGSISFPDRCHEWLELGRVRSVRNSIVHNFGRVVAGGRKAKERDRKARRRILAYFRRREGISRDKHDVIRVESDYLSDIFSVIDHFFGKLQAALEARPI